MKDPIACSYGCGRRTQHICLTHNAGACNLCQQSAYRDAFQAELPESLEGRDLCSTCMEKLKVLMTNPHDDDVEDDADVIIDDDAEKPVVVRVAGKRSPPEQYEQKMKAGKPQKKMKLGHRKAKKVTKLYTILKQLPVFKVDDRIRCCYCKGQSWKTVSNRFQVIRHLHSDAAHLNAFYELLSGKVGDEKARITDAQFKQLRRSYPVNSKLAKAKMRNLEYHPHIRVDSEAHKNEEYKKRLLDLQIKQAGQHSAWRMNMNSLMLRHSAHNAPASRDTVISSIVDQIVLEISVTGASFVQIERLTRALVQIPEKNWEAFRNAYRRAGVPRTRVSEAVISFNDRHRLVLRDVVADRPLCLYIDGGEIGCHADHKFAVRIGFSVGPFLINSFIGSVEYNSRGKKGEDYLKYTKNLLSDKFGEIPWRQISAVITDGESAMRGHGDGFYSLLNRDVRAHTDDRYSVWHIYCASHRINRVLNRHLVGCAKGEGKLKWLQDLVKALTKHFRQLYKQGVIDVFPTGWSDTRWTSIRDCMSRLCRIFDKFKGDLPNFKVMYPFNDDDDDDVEVKSDMIPHIIRSGLKIITVICDVCQNVQRMPLFEAMGVVEAAKKEMARSYAPVDDAEFPLHGGYDTEHSILLRIDVLQGLVAEELLIIIRKANATFKSLVDEFSEFQCGITGEAVSANTVSKVYSAVELNRYRDERMLFCDAAVQLYKIVHTRLNLPATSKDTVFGVKLPKQEFLQQGAAALTRADGWTDFAEIRNHHLTLEYRFLKDQAEACGSSHLITWNAGSRFWCKCPNQSMRRLMGSICGIQAANGNIEADFSHLGYRMQNRESIKHETLMGEIKGKELQALWRLKEWMDNHPDLV